MNDCSIYSLWPCFTSWFKFVFYSNYWRAQLGPRLSVDFIEVTSIISTPVSTRIARVTSWFRQDSHKQTGMVDHFEDFRLRAKADVPEILVKQKRRLHSLYFPHNTLMLTESRGEFSDLHSIFRLRALRCSAAEFVWHLQQFFRNMRWLLSLDFNWKN